MFLLKLLNFYRVKCHAGGYKLYKPGNQSSNGRPSPLRWTRDKHPAIFVRGLVLATFVCAWIFGQAYAGANYADTATMG